MINVPAVFKHASMFSGSNGRRRADWWVALLAAVLIFATAINAQTGAMNAADEPAHDPYFTPTAAKTTSSMPRVIIRNIREDRAGNIWFATFGGPIRYDGKNFTNFGEEVGLANTRIFSLLEDRSGALWFGSITGGASRYDGKSFTKFTEKDGLASNDVHWVFEDRDSNIWFGTTNGVSRYDGDGGAFTNFTTKDGLIDNSVYTIGQDASGRMWFGTQGGICSYDGRSFSNLADQVGRSFVNIRAMAVDRSGNLWFGGQGGAYRYDGKTLTAFTSKNGLFDDFVGSIIVDRAGNVWLGHPGRFSDGLGGASRYDGTSFEHFTQEDGLASLTVYCMLEDTAGNIWFGSVDAGACRYNGRTFTNFSAGDPPSLLTKQAQEQAHATTAPVPPHVADGKNIAQNASSPLTDNESTMAKGETVADIGNSCWVAFQDKDDNHWFGSDGNGMFRYDGKTLTRFTTKDGLAHDQIRGIQQHLPSGHILITTNGGVSKFDGQRFETLPVTEMKPPSAAVLAADHLNAPGAPGAGPLNDPLNEGWLLNANDLWLIGSGGPRRYDGKTLYQLKFPKSPLEDELSARYGTAKNWSSYDVWTVYKDSKGHMWFGTGMFGICRFDGHSLDWMFEPHLTEVEGGGWFGFRAIIEDRNGDYWFNSTQYRFKVAPHGADGQDGGTGKLKYSREKGMDWSAVDTTDKFIHFQSVTQDKNGDLWMAPYAGGVWRHDGNKGTHYPMTIGNPPNQITMFSIYKDNHGDLWVNTHEHGAYKFNGNAFEQFKP